LSGAVRSRRAMGYMSNAVLLGEAVATEALQRGVDGVDRRFGSGASRAFASLSDTRGENRKYNATAINSTGSTRINSASPSRCADSVPAHGSHQCRCHRRAQLAQVQVAEAIKIPGRRQCAERALNLVGAERCHRWQPKGQQRGQRQQAARSSDGRDEAGGECHHREYRHHPRGYADCRPPDHRQWPSWLPLAGHCKTIVVRLSMRGRSNRIG